jgi:protein AroM
MPTLGVITIGQSPRDDMVPELVRHWPGVDVLQAGALDDLTEEEAQRLSRTPGEEILTSLLRTGRSVVLSRDTVLPRLEKRIVELEDLGAAVNLVVCTGEFPPLQHRRPLLLAEALIVGGVGALTSGPVGVICPLAAQIADSERKFGTLGGPVVASEVDPYSAGETAYGAAARKLTEAGADVVVLDCMGYTEQHRGWARTGTDVPVVLARSLVARLVGEVVGA